MISFFVLTQLTQTLLYTFINNNKTLCWYSIRHALYLITALMVTKTNRNGTYAVRLKLMWVRTIMYVVGWVVNSRPTPLKSSVPVRHCPYLLGSKNWVSFYVFVTGGARGGYTKIKTFFVFHFDLLPKTYFNFNVRDTDAYK